MADTWDLAPSKDFATPGSWIKTEKKINMHCVRMMGIHSGMCAMNTEWVNTFMASLNKTRGGGGASK